MIPNHVVFGMLCHTMSTSHITGQYAESNELLYENRHYHVVSYYTILFSINYYFLLHKARAMIYEM